MQTMNLDTSAQALSHMTLIPFTAMTVAECAGADMNFVPAFVVPEALEAHFRQPNPTLNLPRPLVVGPHETQRIATIPWINSKLRKCPYTSVPIGHILRSLGIVWYGNITGYPTVDKSAYGVQNPYQFTIAPSHHARVINMFPHGRLYGVIAKWVLSTENFGCGTSISTRPSDSPVPLYGADTYCLQLVPYAGPHAPDMNKLCSRLNFGNSTEDVINVGLFQPLGRKVNHQKPRHVRMDLALNDSIGVDSRSTDECFVIAENVW